MVASKCDFIQTCTWLWETVEHIPRQSWRLDPGTGGTHMDHDFSNSRRHWSTTVCSPRCSTPSSWYTALVSTKSFLPKSITHHLWVCAWGLSTTLVGASQPKSSSRSIFWELQKGWGCFEGGHHPAVHEVGQSLKRGYFHLPPPPQHLLRSRKTLRCFHCVILPRVLHPQHALPPSVNAPNPPLHNDRNPAPPRGRAVASGCGSRGSRSSSSSSSGLSSGSGSGSESRSGSPARSEASPGTWSVHSVATSVRGVEVLSGDEASGGEHDVSYSTDEADVSQGSIPLLDISATDDEETRKCKVREVVRRSDTDFAAWKEREVNKGMKGIEERDKMVNDYMDGKRKPKNPDTLAPPRFLHGGMWGVSTSGFYNQYSGAMSFLPHGP